MGNCKTGAGNVLLSAGQEGNAKKAGRWAKAGSGKMQIPGPSRRQMLRKEFVLFLPAPRSAALSPASSGGIQGRKEPYSIYLTYQFFARVGTGRKKECYILTWYLSYPVLVWTTLLNPKSAFLFRHEIWSGRHFNTRPSFLLTPVDLRRLFDQCCCSFQIDTRPIWLIQFKEQPSVILLPLP